MITNANDLLRAENLAERHSIPLGTLVEVDAEFHNQHGVRAFIVEHIRDCDGEPTYGISLVGLEVLEAIKFYNENAYRYCISFGWLESNLKIIRGAK